MSSAQSRGLARSYRLTRTSEIRALARSRLAKRRTDRYFRVIFMENRLDRPRLCLGIPSRLIRRAVDRNRARRIIRESFRRCRDRLRNLDILVVARYPVHTVESRELRAVLARFWNRLQ